MLGGEMVVDSVKALLVWEVPYYPTYYFPAENVQTSLLVETGETRRSPSRGEATQYVVKAGNGEGAAYAFLEPKIEAIDGHYAFVWRTLDHWFEEDEEVFVHPRDPYTRIDILASSRRVRVEIDGVTVADTTNGSFLVETGLPMRYYIPKTDVRMDLLTPTDLATECPYKGTARYWSATIDGETHDNIVWGYDSPLPESQKVAGLVGFTTKRSTSSSTRRHSIDRRPSSPDTAGLVSSARIVTRRRPRGGRGEPGSPQEHAGLVQLGNG